MPSAIISDLGLLMIMLLVGFIIIILSRVRYDQLLNGTGRVHNEPGSPGLCGLPNRLLDHVDHKESESEMQGDDVFVEAPTLLWNSTKIYTLSKNYFHLQDFQVINKTNPGNKIIKPQHGKEINVFL
ncbi:unnamed protein product [Orchesella dallaii]|uniref:Uncharacterized protein n=1 Tax=Orchesella dallaii TaxID=48710 RepID=A0ABP1QP95_9HEXA